MNALVAITIAVVDQNRCIGYLISDSQGIAVVSSEEIGRRRHVGGMNEGGW